MQDFSGEHKQFEFSSDEAKRIWDSTGQTIDLGGKQYQVSNPGNGNRVLTPLNANQSMASAAQSQLDFQRQANLPVTNAIGSQMAYAPTVFAAKGSALSNQIDPLKQRYESALSALTAGSQTAVAQAQTGASREFGARGISLDSSAFGQYLQNQTLPISSSYAGQYGNLKGNEADAMLELQNQIANVPIEQQQYVNQLGLQKAQSEAGNPESAISSALQYLNLQQQASDSAAARALQEKIANMQYQPQSSGVKDNYLSLPEGNTLFNLLTGQAQYTAPKQFASKVGAAGGDPLGLL